MLKDVLKLQAIAQVGGGSGGGGVKIDGEVILPKTTIEITTDAPGMLFESIGLVAGETYTAVIAGNIYEAQASDHTTDMGNGEQTVGTTIAFGEFTVLEVLPEFREMVGGAAAMVSSVLEGRFEFMVVHGTVSISYLDRMTLPAFKVRFTLDGSDYSAITADKTFEEALFAAKNGYDFKAELRHSGGIYPLMLTIVDADEIRLTYWVAGLSASSIVWDEGGISHFQIK